MTLCLSVDAQWKLWWNKKIHYIMFKLQHQFFLAWSSGNTFAGDQNIWRIAGNSEELGSRWIGPRGGGFVFWTGSLIWLQDPVVNQRASQKTNPPPRGPFICCKFFSYCSDSFRCFDSWQKVLPESNAKKIIAADLNIIIMNFLFHRVPTEHPQRDTEFISWIFVFRF